MNENALAIVCKDLEAIVNTCSLAALSDYGKFDRAFKLASGINALRAKIDNSLMKEIMPLQNSALGFRTDKTDGYPANVVKECLIEAVLRGAMPVGNEFNIISGRAYFTKEYFARMIREFPGLTDLKIIPGVPRVQNGGAIVSMAASWKVSGSPDSISREVPVRVNNGMGADAILGKATRKIMASIYGQLTGSEYATHDGEADDLPPQSGSPANSGKNVSDRLREAETITPEKSEPSELVAKCKALPPVYLARAKGHLNLTVQVDLLTDEQAEQVLAVAGDLMEADGQSEQDSGSVQ